MSEIITNQIESGMSVTDIQAMIEALGQTENGEPLKKAMNELQRALLDNPDACALMSEESIGEAVRNLRRLTGQLIVAEAGKTKKKEGKFEITKESLAAIDDELFDKE